jgi:Cytosol aminopeptidase family, N-terminal domain
MKRFGWMQGTLVFLLIAASGVHGFGQAASVLPVKVLVQSPAETKTELQIFCLFRSSPENTLHGSLVEINDKLHGLLDQIRKPGLFGGELGETILLTPPAGTLAAKRVLIIGLGDSATFTPERMYLVSKIALRNANRLGVAHPFFAPTILDGGVTKFSTGEVAGQVVRGLRDAVATESVLRAGGAAGALVVVDFTFLAGAAHAAETQSAIDRALGKMASAPR